MATLKIDYDLADFPNSKFNFERLINEIEKSSIEISLDYEAGLSGNGSGGCSINFKTDISESERTTLNGIIAAHSGEPLNLGLAVNSEGFQKIVIKPDADVSSTWIAKKIVEDEAIVLPLKWEPTAGRKLSVTQTILIIAKEMVMDKTLHFKGYNTGILGNKNFTRTYTSLWDYQYGCDKYHEFSDTIRMEWYYAPIVLLSSKSAKIEIEMPDGAQVGTKGAVKLICLSEVE